MRKKNLIIFLCTISAITISYEETEAQKLAEVFAPGIVSVEGDNVYRGTFHPDGGSYYFFRKVTQGEEDYRIYVTHLKNGEWTDPEQIYLGGDYSDLYPTISPNGKKMVFTSYRPLPDNNIAPEHATLWYVEWSDGKWVNPTYMVEASRPPNYHAQPLFHSNGDLQFISITPDWKTREQRLVSWDGNRYTNLRPDTIFKFWKDVDIREGVINPDEDLIIMIISGDLWYATKNEKEEWTIPKKFEGNINTSKIETFPVFSPSGSHIYYTSNFEKILRFSFSKIIE